MKRGVFFDLYGTLINIRTDENDQWVYAMLSRYLAYQSIDISPEELKKELWEGVQRYLHSSKETCPEVDVYKIFIDIMNKHAKKRCSKGMVVDIAILFRSLTIRNFGIFDGLYDALSCIGSRYKTAIISDAQWVFAEPEIAILGLDQFFRIKIFSSRYGFKKPDERLFIAAMEKLGVSPQDSVYIGDNLSKDIPGAKKAGMKFILFGSSNSEYNGYKPDKVFAHYSELNGLLNEIM